MNNDRGAATLVGLALVALILLGTAIVGQLGRAVVVERRTGSAADLTALAAAAAVLRLAGDPCLEAAAIARANGTELARCLITYQPDGLVAAVRVTSQAPVWPLPRASAAAVAGLRPISDAGPGRGSLP